MNRPDLYRLLDWDSAFFRKRIGRILPSRVTAEEMSAAIDWADISQLDCLYFLCEANDPESSYLAQVHRFRLVDIRMTLESCASVQTDKSNSAIAGGVRPAEERDLPFLKSLARSSHRDSRFYADPDFDRDRCDAFYECWIEKSCGGWAEVVLTATVEECPVGYISCHFSKEVFEGSIGLLAVDARAQGNGFGRLLVASAMTWFSQRGAKRVTVVTQGANTRAQRLYQRCGFVTQSLQLWYHRWKHEVKNRYYE